MAELKYKIQINTPAEKVWDVLADFGGIYRWNPGVKSSQTTSPENGGVGATRHCALIPMGEVDERITRWEPGKSLDIETVKFTRLPMKYGFLTLTVTPNAEGTEVTAHNKYDMGSGLMAKIMDMRKDLAAQGTANMLNGLKHFVETGNEVTASTKLQASAVPA